MKIQTLVAGTVNVAQEAHTEAAESARTCSVLTANMPPCVTTHHTAWLQSAILSNHSNLPATAEPCTLPQ